MVHFIVSTLLGLAGNSVGLMGGSIFKDPKVASGVVPMFVMPMILFVTLKGLQTIIYENKFFLSLLSLNKKKKNF